MSSTAFDDIDCAACGARMSEFSMPWCEECRRNECPTCRERIHWAFKAILRNPPVIMPLA